MKNVRLYFGPYLPSLGVIGAVSTVAAFAEAAVLILFVAAAARLAGGSDEGLSVLGYTFELSTATTIVMAGLALTVRVTGQVSVAFLMGRVAGRYEADKRSELFARFVHASWDAQSGQRAGHFLDVLKLDVEIGRHSMEGLATSAAATTNFTVLVVGAILIDPVVTGAIVVAVGLVTVVLRPLTLRGRRMAERRTALSTEAANEIAQTVMMAKEIDVFDVREVVTEQMRGRMHEMGLNQAHFQFMERLVPALYQSIALLLAIAALGLVYLLGLGDLAALAAVILLLLRALYYSQQLQQAYHNFGARLPYLRRVEKLAGEYEDARWVDEGQDVDGIDRLAFENVSFEYVEGTPVLRDVCFSVSRGEVIGIVGPSGSGKSTILQILLRLRRPTNGTFSVNGVDTTRISRASWYRHVTMVPQEPLLIDDTMAENIRFYRDGVTEAEMWSALERAGLSDEVHSFDRGLETLVGERGSEVSGGQRQRLCIARALVGGPDVVVLDEPTSALDVHSERTIQATLAGLRGHVTTFVIAHRLSTLSVCDRIMVLREGRVDGFAAPEELMETNAYYADAVREQAS